jgi:tetratricopeptide (TPR) repeat protein
MGKLEEAAARLLPMRRLADELDDPGQASGQFALSEARILVCRGDWANAARVARESLPERRRLGDLQGEAEASHPLADALLEAHFAARAPNALEWDEAEHALTRALEIGQAGPAFWTAARCRCLLSALLANQGRREEARSHLEEARSLARQRPQTLFEAVVLWADGRLAMAEERWPEAVAAFEAMVGLYGELGARWYWARGLIDWAEALAAGGEPAGLQRAVGLLRQSRAAFEEMGAPGYVALVQKRLVELAAAEE